jgi:hypothetical protein
MRCNRFGERQLLLTTRDRSGRSPKTRNDKLSLDRVTVQVLGVRYRSLSANQTAIAKH